MIEEKEMRPEIVDRLGEFIKLNGMRHSEQSKKLFPYVLIGAVLSVLLSLYVQPNL